LFFFLVFIYFSLVEAIMAKTKPTHLTKAPRFIAVEVKTPRFETCKPKENIAICYRCFSSGDISLWQGFKSSYGHFGLGVKQNNFA
jgi:hypothetical protein